MSEQDEIVTCPDCGQSMTLTPGIDYFCRTPACTAKAREEFKAALRKDYQESEGWKSRDDIFAELQVARQQLSEARGKIEELTVEADQYAAEITRLRNDDCFDDDEEYSLEPPVLERRTIGIVVPEEDIAAKDERIASLEAAIGKVLKSYEKLPSNLTPPKWLAEVRAAYEGTEDA